MERPCLHYVIRRNMATRGYSERRVVFLLRNLRCHSARLVGWLSCSIMRHYVDLKQRVPTPLGRREGGPTRRRHGSHTDDTDHTKAQKVSYSRGRDTAALDSYLATWLPGCLCRSRPKETDIMTSSPKAYRIPQMHGILRFLDS